jgi:aminomethyltransferase
MARALPLHAWHAARQAQFTEPDGREQVVRYGDALAEYQAARGAGALFDLSFRDLLQIRGPDRVSFLHGMVTQDVKGLEVGRTAYTALLTAKGAMVADARLLHRPEDLWLDLEPGRGPAVKEFLERYLVSEDAEIIDASGGLVILGLRGPSSPGVLAAVGLPVPSAGRGEAFQLGGTGGWAVAAPDWAPQGVDLFFPSASGEQLAQVLLERGATNGLRLAGQEAAEWLRVEAGIPRYGVDMDEKTLPLEAGLSSALHYQKGCYIGQEVVARQTFRGHVNKKLTGLRLGDSSPAPKTELRVQERKVGYLTSVVRSPSLGEQVGLGYVHRDFLTPGTRLTLGDTGASATVAALPFTTP